jgi:pseudolysin/vibriolysin
VDVVAHEIAHGFTEDHAALEYSGQSGGIDESMSDIVGEAAERYVYGNNDYLLGDTVYVHTGARSLCNPEKDGYSIDHVTKYIDGMDPHYCSGDMWPCNILM